MGSHITMIVGSGARDALFRTEFHGPAHIMAVSPDREERWLV
jgi:hypothetical protein